MTTIPAGWKLVPIEPTRKMWEAVNKLDDEMAAGAYDGKGASIEQIWACLVDAAPSCLTCGDHGMVGGLTPHSGYDAEPCPDCTAPASPVSTVEQGEDGQVTAILWTIMRDAQAAKELCGDDPESAAAVRNSKLAGIAGAAAQALGLVKGPEYPAPAAGDALELKRKTDLIAELSKIIHNMTVGQQAAWIEWQHGAGAEAAMQWIENGLVGPGHVPDEDASYGKEAQAYYDANQADPLPICHCGRPSNILHMGNGYCCQEHYSTGRAAIAAQRQGDA